MKFIPYILSLLCFSTTVAAQINVEILGDPAGIILDLEIDEEKKSIIASTPKDVQKWNYEDKLLLNRWNFSNIQDLDQFENSMAGVSKSGALFVWDVQQNDTGREYQITTVPLNCLVWIDSVWIAVGSDDALIYKVNSQTGEIQKSIKSNGSVTSMARSKNWLLAGNSTGEVAIYFANDLIPMKFVKAHKKWIRDIHVVDSTGTYVTVADDAKLKRWTSEFELASEFDFSSSWLLSVDYFIDSEKSTVFTVGDLAGDLTIHTRFGIYSSEANASINKIIIFRECLPKLKVVIATLGGGIQLWGADVMKLRTN